MKPHPTHLMQPNRRQRVLSALRDHGPMALEPLAAAADTAYTVLPKTMAAMVQAGDVVVLGRADDLGFTDMRKDARIYALPDTPKPQPQREARSPRKGKSGVIAGPITIGRGYKWGAGLA